MPLTMKPMRFAHLEGHTGVCYDTSDKRAVPMLFVKLRRSWGIHLKQRKQIVTPASALLREKYSTCAFVGGIATCGADGDVRYWLDLMDDDPSSVCISEQAIAIVSKNGKLYVGNDNNTVQIITIPDLDKVGVVTSFSAAVSALATTKDSKYIVSGACDMKIKVTDIETSDTIELNGHEAPILGLSLDPKEEYVASSSADGSIRIWKISEKTAVHTWNNVVPKCNSFFTAKTYSTPSFHSKDGSTLAYPDGKEIVVVERDTWKEKTRFKYPDLRTELSICTYSECGTRLAASSVHGEIVVWDVNSEETIGYVEQSENSKITSLIWSLKKPNELTFCNSRGRFGCVDVVTRENSPDGAADDAASCADVEDELEFGGDDHRAEVTDNDDEDDDDENVISLKKIKTSVARLEDDAKSEVNTELQRIQQKVAVPEIALQAPFQPGSSPVHLLSRFMVWNDTGIVRCYASEDFEDSSIEIEFHDTTIHHTMHINNYLRHTLAALSPQALALSCPAVEGTPSKLVVVVLQGWGSGNKEWSVDFPEGEESVCLAVGETFVAVATSRRNLRLFMVSGTQREIVALPGAPVAMNGLGSNLLVAYHSGVGISNEQHMNLMWIRIRGADLRSQTLSVPLAPSCELSWLGLSDLASPMLMDEEGVVRMYDKKASLWRVACDTDQQLKGKMDHFFIIGVSERERTIRCVLCKGSRYPPTTPRPTVNEIPLALPLCEPDSEKSTQESQMWQIGSNEVNQEALLALIALACISNVEYRAVDLCEQIASPSLLEIAIKYATRKHRMALANKLKSIAENKDSQEDENEAAEELETELESHNDEVEKLVNTPEDSMLTPIGKKKLEIEIKPLSLSGGMRKNPFIKVGPAPPLKDITVLNTLPDKPQKPKSSVTTVRSKSPQRSSKVNAKRQESFSAWLAKNSSDLREEFPDLSNVEFSKAALERYKEEFEGKEVEAADRKKRKLSSPEDQDGKVKRSAPNKLAQFLYDKQ